MAPAAIPPLMSSDEVNLLVYSYLAESCLDHSAFTLYSESRLGDFLHSQDDTPPSIPPTGHLIRILQKGLLYLQAEAKYRGEDVSANPPRLIGYSIPDTLPLPPIPQSLPPPSPPPPASSSATVSSKKRQQPAASSSAAAAAIANTASTNLKRKESASNGDVNARSASEDLPGQTHPKKQRMAAKSPSASTSDSVVRDASSSGATGDAMDTDEVHKTDSDGCTIKGGSSSLQTVKGKKGKGKAADAAYEGELSGGEIQSGAVSKPTSATGSASGSDKGVKSSSIQSTTKTALPTTASAATLSKSDGANTPESRRSSSPSATVRKPNGVSNLTKERNRPRSASPNTSLRSVSSTANPPNNRNIPTAATPTIDSSKSASSASQLSVQAIKLSSPESKLPVTPAIRLQPKHLVRKDEVTTLKGHTMPVQPCHWNPQVEALLATGSGDSTMRIWDVPSEPTTSPITSTVVCKHSSGQRRSDVTALEWNVDGSLLASGSEDGIARIWTPSGDLHLVLSMHQRTIFCVKWNNTGSMLLTGSLDHSICLWDTGYGKVKQQWSTHADSILDLDWMTDDVFASCSMDKMINIHQVGRNTPVYRFKGHADEVNCIRFCPNNRHLASCSDDNTVRVWSLQPVKNTLGLSDKEVQKAGSDSDLEPKLDGEDNDRPFLVLRGHAKEVHCVSWCPKISPSSPKLLASASFDATARIWDALTGSCLYVFNRHTDMVYSLAWQPEGNYLATGSNDKKMCVLKVPRNKNDDNATNTDDIELSLEYEHPGPIYEICWHPTRGQIAVCGKYEGVNVVNFDLPKSLSA